MDRNFQTYFTTGEFAKLCKVNKRTLFHYHDIGLFSPAKTDENGYRYYSYQQLEVFSTISILKELNVPLKEIKTYIDERTPEQFIELSKLKIAEIDKEIEKLNTIKHFLKESIVFTNKGLNADCDNILLEQQQEEYIIRSPLLNKENVEDDIKFWVEFGNFAETAESKNTSFTGTMLSKQDIMQHKYDTCSYFFTKTSKKQSNASIVVKPKGLYAVAYYKGDYEHLDEGYERVIKFFEQNHFEMGDFAYEEFLIDEVATKNEKDYIMQITIEVKR
jgi:DNA-binding transcriptional MerR regulator/effector-binding domain-containing protein